MRARQFFSLIPLVVCCVLVSCECNKKPTASNSTEQDAISLSKVTLITSYHASDIDVIFEKVSAGSPGQLISIDNVPMNDDIDSILWNGVNVPFEPVADNECFVSLVPFLPAGNIDLAVYVGDHSYSIPFEIETDTSLSSVEYLESIHYFISLLKATIDTIDQGGYAEIMTKDVNMQAATVFCLDKSPSMDFEFQNIDADTAQYANRMEAATAAIEGMLVGMDERYSGVQYGLVTFCEDQTVEQELTTDVSLVVDKLSDITTCSYTGIGDGLLSSIGVLGRDGGAIILITDGENTSGYDPVEVAVEISKLCPVEIHVIGIDLNDVARDQMQTMVDSCNGYLYDNVTETGLVAVFDTIQHRIYNKNIMNSMVCNTLESQGIAAAGFKSYNSDSLQEYINAFEAYLNSCGKGDIAIIGSYIKNSQITELISYKLWADKGIHADADADAFCDAVPGQVEDLLTQGTVNLVSSQFGLAGSIVNANIGGMAQWGLEYAVQWNAPGLTDPILKQVVLKGSEMYGLYSGMVGPIADYGAKLNQCFMLVTQCLDMMF